MDLLATVLVGVLILVGSAVGAVWLTLLVDRRGAARLAKRAAPTQPDAAAPSQPPGPRGHRPGQAGPAS